jgi:formylglycine-generating enzyme required for sulfatase activity/GTPase SAR1 family protein
MQTNFDIPPNLIRSFSANEVSIFIGAGVSCQAGLPSWEATINAIKDILINMAKKRREGTEEKKFLKSANFLEIVERFKTISTSEEYNSFLYSQFFPSPPIPPSVVHKKLAKLPVKHIITTNFDILMETALQEELGYSPLCCTNYRQVVQAGSQSNKYMIKLHGCIKDLSTVVFSESDYRDFNVTQKPFLEFLRSELDTGVILFLGYSMRDPDFISILNNSLVYTSGSKRDDYAIFKGMNQINKENWKSKGVKILDIQNFNDLETLLDHMLYLIENPKIINQNNYIEHPALKNQLIKNSKDKYQLCSIFGLSSFCKIENVFVHRILRGDVETYVIPTEINDFLIKKKRILITGEPGSGKSYLVDYLAYYLTHFKNDFDVVIKIPLIELNENKEQDLLLKIIEYIASDLGVPYLRLDIFKALFKKNKVILLLDGLDEVIYSYREHMLRIINDLQREFSTVSIVITTRKINTTKWVDFKQFTLMGMTYDDSLELIDFWFQSFKDKSKSYLTSKAKDIIKMHPCFSDNALLISAVCRVVVESTEVKLTRTGIFKQITEWMFENYKLSDKEFILELTNSLKSISVDMWNQNQSHRISNDDLRKKLISFFADKNTEILVDEIIRIFVEEIGILRNTIDNNLAFIYKSFFEYFVADGIVTDGNIEKIICRCNESPLENIIRFIIGLSTCDVQEKYMQNIWKCNSQLALRCVKECSNVKIVLPKLHTIDLEEELLVLIKSLPVRLAPIELVEALEPLFIRQSRNPNVLYFAVNILEDIVRDSSVEAARIMAENILCGFWSEKDKYGNKPVLIKIEGGEYWIGDDEGIDSDERPRHKVRLSSYFVGETLVTNKDYLTFCPTYLIDRLSNGLEMPVTNITWYEASLYCRWILGNGGRLPSEAEWEVAARGKINDTRQFPWGDEPNENMANFNRNVGHATIVKTYKPNEIGLYDVCGNVFEWCYDWYDGEYYKSSPCENPMGIPSGRYKSMRGGCWAREAVAARCAYRVRQIPQTRDVLVGFRVSI